MSTLSRVFWLRDRRSSRAANPGTCVARRPAGIAPDPRERFLSCHAEIRRELATLRRPGVAVLAMDAGGLQAVASLAQKPDALNAAILGRHTSAELSLASDPSLSLRHLAFAVPPDDGSGRIRARVLDLRTVHGFADERGRRHRGLELDGPAFITCGAYAILVAPTPTHAWLEADPATAWARFPEREYGDVPEAGWDAPAPAARGLCGVASTLIRGRVGPRELGDELLRRGEDPVGQLVLRSGRREATAPVGAAALAAGILLGRSDRCSGSELMASPYVSRVHLVILGVAGRVYAIDAASRNGVARDGAPVRALGLSDGSRLSLAEEVEVAWHFVH